MRRVLFLSILLALPIAASAQKPYDEPVPVDWSWGVKTNLLYDATTTMNLGVEFRTGRKSSIDIPINWNPWTFKDNRKWRHILVQPEFRWWTRRTFDGHFFGIHAHYAYYNVGRLPHGPLSQNMADNRYQGWGAGAGISYGYRWSFCNPRWAMEATVGVGYAYLDYDKYECRECGQKLKSGTRNYFGPTKIGLSLIYNIGKKRSDHTTESDHVSVVMPQPMVYHPQFAASYLTSEVEVVTKHRESGRAYIDFPVGRTKIVPEYKNNAAELQKIDALIASVEGNPKATITHIAITGYASPEGGWQTNRTLSEKRAAALTDYIETKYGFPADIFTTSGAGENWVGLDSLVSNSDMPHKEAILEIIRNKGVFDGREADLMHLAGGQPYRRMRAEMFPQLRRVDYAIYYTMQSSATEIDSAAADLNAAADALGRKDAASAALHLERVEGYAAERMNNMGILAFLQGDPIKAAEYFARAAAAGSTQAVANAKELEKHIQSK